jgi:hypothetical protein
MEPRNFRGVVPLFVRILLQPLVIAYFALALAREYWIPAAVYVLLRSCLCRVGASFVWLVAAAGVLGFLGGLTYFVAKAFTRLRSTGRVAMRAKKSGDLETYRLNLGQWRIQLRKVRLWPLGLALLSIHAVLPSVSALVLAGGTPALVRDHGKLRYASSDERIRLMLHRMEKRGIFTPLNRD